MYQHRECLNASVKSMTRLGKKMVEIGSGFLGKSFFFLHYEIRNGDVSI